MEKLYRSYILKPENEITEDQISISGFGFRLYYSDELKCDVVESLDGSKKILWVLYYSSILTKDIRVYHNMRYSSLMLGIGEKLINGIKIDFYQDFKIIKHSIETFYDDNRPKLTQEFDHNFELVEYRCSIYDDGKKHIKEKIFFAQSWTVHAEDI